MATRTDSQAVVQPTGGGGAGLSAALYGPPIDRGTVQVVPPVTVTPDVNPYPSSAVVSGATRDTGSDVTPSSARVQYGGPQITATRDTGGYGGGILGLLHEMAGMVSPAAFLQNLQHGKGPASVPQSAAKVTAKNPGGGGSGAIGSVADPQLAPPMDPNALALQMFFTQTIAPYLDSLRQSMSHNADMSAAAMQHVLPQINPALQPFFQPQQMVANTRTLADALAATTAAAPSYDQLISQISAAQDAQRYAAYQAMKSQAASGAGSLLGSLLGAAGGSDDLSGLLGGDLANAAKKQA